MDQILGFRIPQDHHLLRGARHLVFRGNILPQLKNRRIYRGSVLFGERDLVSASRAEQDHGCQQQENALSFHTFRFLTKKPGTG